MAPPNHPMVRAPERWPSGRRRTPAKGVRVKSPSRVRIPLSPPVLQETANALHAARRRSSVWDSNPRNQTSGFDEPPRCSASADSTSGARIGILGMQSRYCLSFMQVMSCLSLCRQSEMSMRCSRRLPIPFVESSWIAYTFRVARHSPNCATDCRSPVNRCRSISMCWNRRA
jgi:hypothetical protein